ncbi:MAG: U32 family peptidase [Candidatus Pacebacteria bacterium]|nr:U32 family peptidase [Candidatus Paceibacterota bacterium]
MKTKFKKPELMSPIKDWASLEACKKYCNAVYFGVEDLNLRARSDAIKTSEMKSFAEECHKNKIKAYLTINSVIYDCSIKKAEKLVEKAKISGIDAVIVWDPAVIEIAKKWKMPFIISTQANVSNIDTIKFYKNLGAKRVVLARELSLEQIRKIKKAVKNIEIEIFVHGAMCVAISGRCILSAYLFGKSSNCGSCAQPCRKEWFLTDENGNSFATEGKYFLNAKDLCMIEFIPELIESGVESFKIEGRRRDPKYIETTAKCYREAIDSYFDKTFSDEKVKKWKKELINVYNRGFSTGFYFSEPGKEGISYNQADNISRYKKELVGNIKHCYPKAKAISLDLKHTGIKIGDKIVIEGAKTFLEQKISSIEVENKKVKKALKGQEVAILINGSAANGDKVFIIKKR